VAPLNEREQELNEGKRMKCHPIKETKPLLSNLNYILQQVFFKKSVKIKPENEEEIGVMGWPG
jgi:hypothetical protein